MIKRTFLDKSTTIVRDSGLNYGLNPICMLNYGLFTSRFLVHFNTEDLIKMSNDGTITSTNSVHKLKMKNCGSIDKFSRADKLTSIDINGYKERAVSFSVIATKIPKSWDMGVGFDNETDFWIQGKGITSTDGATWEKASNIDAWDNEGIYTTDELIIEYGKFKSGYTSVIVAEQHFDFGNEDLELDITNYINDIISGSTENNGLCISFIPDLEETETEVTQYVGFFNEKTNTIFAPVLETKINNTIHDDRYNFILGKKNNLYLYSNIGGDLENIDTIPTCIIKDQCDNAYTTTVKQVSKGIYCAEVENLSGVSKNSVLYDIWSNLKYSGETIDDVENSFEVKGKENYFNITSKYNDSKKLNPIVVGINYDEQLNLGEKRIISVYYRVPYTKEEYNLVKNSWYRIYVKNGDKELTIVDWDEMNLIEDKSTFQITTNEFIPATYYVDIKAKFGNDICIFKDELHFEIKSDTTKQRY